MIQEQPEAGDQTFTFFLHNDLNLTVLSLTLESSSEFHVFAFLDSFVWFERLTPLPLLSFNELAIIVIIIGVEAVFVIKDL
jgi:hypothetical protein